MNTQLRQPIPTDYLAVAQRMPPDEIAQYLATANEAQFLASAAAFDMAAATGLQHCVATLYDRPLALGGYVPVQPGTWAGWLVSAAEDWPEYGLEITRHCRRLQRGMFARTDCHRIEVFATRERTRAHQWYVEGLGMELEGPRRKYFANGTDSLCFVALKEG